MLAEALVGLFRHRQQTVRATRNEACELRPSRESRLLAAEADEIGQLLVLVTGKRLATPRRENGAPAHRALPEPEQPLPQRDEREQHREPDQIEVVLADVPEDVRRQSGLTVRVAAAVALDRAQHAAEQIGDVLKPGLSAGLEILKDAIDRRPNGDRNQRALRIEVVSGLVNPRSPSPRNSRRARR